MISGYKQLTMRYLKASKKRTILTIIGIVLSVALMSTIGLFFNAIQMAEIEQVVNDYGRFHIVFTKTNEEIINKVINNPKVSRYGFYSIGEKFKIGDKVTANEIIATDKALELFSYRVKDGRLPQKENEVAIEKWVLDNIDKNVLVGNEIKVNDRTYILTGVLENSIINQIDNKGVILLLNNNIDKNSCALAVEVSSRTNIRKAVDELKQLGDENTVMENGYLLSVLGASDSGGMAGLYLVLAVIISIVVISTIAVIYNSFQISVVERIKQFGLLRAIGTTPKQIRIIVLREATILAIIGIPIGLLCGIIALYGIDLVFRIIGASSVFALKIVISTKIMLLSTAVGLVSIYLSALLPVLFAGKISPLVAISSRAFITKEKIKRRKSGIVQKLFGFEGALAIKNIRRNRKRYIITVFSIVISVVLFISFNSFMGMAFTVNAPPNESQDIHFSVISNIGATDADVKIEENLINDIKALKDIESVYRVYNAENFNTIIDKDMQIDEIKAIRGIYAEDDMGRATITGSVVIYDAEALEVAKRYLQSGSIDIKRLNQEDGVIIINSNRFYNFETKKNYYGSIANIKIGDEFELQHYSNKGEFEIDNIKKVKVIAILNRDPFDYRGNSGGLKVVATKKLVESLSHQQDIKPINLNIKIRDIKSEESAQTAIESVISSNSSLRLINYIDNNRVQKTSRLMIQFLIYGFVVVVSLIGSVNIINTITTNIILRKREFAMLKSIGLTQKGLRKIIVFEGLLYGIFGTIYGSIIGTGVSFLLYKGIADAREFAWSIPWNAIIIAGIAAIIIGYVSVLAPLARINKQNLIEAVREDF